jgi:hypothetical protein
MKKYFALTILLLTALAACTKEGGDEKDKKPVNVTIYKASMPKHVFGFGTQNRYSYCPSIVDNGDGTTHVFFCGTQSNIMVDNIYHIQENADGTRTQEKSVLQPSLDWDSRHDCDPSVIEGDFKMDGVSYRYALFFLSNPLEWWYNEIGVAFSNDLAADSWVKYPYQVVKKPKICLKRNYLTNSSSESSTIPIVFVLSSICCSMNPKTQIAPTLNFCLIW